MRAERPIVDLHRLDANFQLFAADSNVPWKPVAVRLDTYSSAPVAFSVYQVDPADVLTAGSNSAPRAIVTSRRRALLSFAFAPPGGYQFQSSDVNVPLGSREGFFVVEARRGNVGEQVWINRSRIGLLSKETPGGLLLYGADLGTAMPLQRMRVQFVVNQNFVTLATDGEGIVRWNRLPRPVFALAQWGNSFAFLSFLPQPPLPSTIVGVRTDSAVVHAGDAVRIVGFARTRLQGILRPSTGDATVSLRFGASTIAQRQVPLDRAGAFATAFEIPANSVTGEYSVLAQAAGGVGGATVEVEGNAAGLSLDVSAACNFPCDYRQDVPLLIHASRGGTNVRVIVVRSTHVYLGEGPESAPWAPSPWMDTTVTTDESGNATVQIPRPNDDLSSTYGVRVESGGATADTRVTVPTAQAAIRLIVDRSEQSLGTPIGFDVYANSLDGAPLAGAVVTVDLMHGASAARQQLTLDENGHARGSFSAPELGTDFLFAWTDRGGRAKDATQVRIDPQAAGVTSGGSANVHLSVDRKIYRSGDEIGIDAEAPGSQGEALITFESALGVQFALVRTSGGRAVAHLRAQDAAGELRVGAAFVHDGAIEWDTMPLALAAPGRPRSADLLLPSELAAGQSATVGFDGNANGPGTFAVRISRGTPSGSAAFASAPALLAVGVTTTQNSAAETTTWHPWVNSTGEHATVLDFVRRSQPPPELALAQAETDDISWSVARADGKGVAVALPQRSGRYEVSVLGISDDGSVTAGSSTVVVR
ncbi:MAG TPA: hypothetical protein VFF63_02205 [Candidatus Babeliales bacterium]|nr:hypothetical protein [Candidatus Babeliales bacterium]